ncbi:MAG: hypothetical protein QXU40_01445 [Candidatus Pacearchaeota archaeon]
MKKKNYYCNQCGKNQRKSVPERFLGCSYCKAKWPYLVPGKINEEEKLQIFLKNELSKIRSVH